MIKQTPSSGKISDLKATDRVVTSQTTMIHTPIRKRIDFGGEHTPNPNALEVRVNPPLQVEFKADTNPQPIYQNARSYTQEMRSHKIEI